MQFLMEMYAVLKWKCINKLKILDIRADLMARIYRIANGYQLVARFLLVFRALLVSKRTRLLHVAVAEIC